MGFDFTMIQDTFLISYSIFLCISNPLILPFNLILCFVDVLYTIKSFHKWERGGRTSSVMGTHEYKFNSKHENLICLLNMILLYQLITHTWCAVIALDFVLSFHIYMGMCNFVCLISYLYKTTSIIYNDDVTEISPFIMIMRIRKFSSGILPISN